MKEVIEVISVHFVLSTAPLSSSLPLFPLFFQPGLHSFTLCSCSLSSFLLSLCPYVFVLMLYHFESHLSLSLSRLILSILVFSLFPFSLTDSALVCTPSPPPPLHILMFAQTYTLAHTLPPLSLTRSPTPATAPVCPALVRTWLGLPLWNLGNVSSSPIDRREQVQQQTTCRWTRERHKHTRRSHESTRCLEYNRYLLNLSHKCMISLSSVDFIGD